LFLPEGYTSISVREPLANIKAQTKVTNQRSRTQELVDSHYATVSDDSGELRMLVCRGCRQIHGLSLLKNEEELCNRFMRSIAWLPVLPAGHWLVMSCGIKLYWMGDCATNVGSLRKVTWMMFEAVSSLSLVMFSSPSGVMAGSLECSSEVKVVTWLCLCEQNGR